MAPAHGSRAVRLNPFSFRAAVRTLVERQELLELVVLIPSLSGLRFEQLSPRNVAFTVVLIPSLSGLRFERDPGPPQKPRHGVLIPSLSGLRFERGEGREVVPSRAS